MNAIPRIHKSHYKTQGLREGVTSTRETYARTMIQNQEFLGIPQGINHVESLCHLLKLPTELRLEIWRYLIQQPIEKELIFDLVRGHIFTDVFLHTKYPTSLSGIFLSFNRELYKEIKDVFYNITTFVIHVDGNGALLCK
jgi:hypothetical protein